MQCGERRVSGRRGTQAAIELARDRDKTARGTKTDSGETQDAYADDKDNNVWRQAGDRERMLSEDSERHINECRRITYECRRSKARLAPPETRGQT